MNGSDGFRCSGAALTASLFGAGVLGAALRSDPSSESNVREYVALPDTLTVTHHPSTSLLVNP